MPRRWILLALASLFLPVPLLAAEKPLRTLIDAEVRAAWEREKIAAPALADDATFLRRIYLDLLGTIPTHDEVKSFLADKGTDKRTKLIDKLLDDPRFAAQQADVWDLLLFGRNPPGYEATRQPRGVPGLADSQVRQERTVRPLGAQPPPGRGGRFRPFSTSSFAISRKRRRSPSAGFSWARSSSAPAATIIPIETVDAARFLRHGRLLRPAGRHRRRGQGRQAALPDRREEQRRSALHRDRPRSRSPARRASRSSRSSCVGPRWRNRRCRRASRSRSSRPARRRRSRTFSRKEKLADWIVAPDNPYFARAAANRDLGPVHGPRPGAAGRRPQRQEPAQPSRHVRGPGRGPQGAQIRPEMADSGAGQQRTYQAAGTGEVREALPRWFERARVRPLTAEEMLAAISVATGYEATGGKIGGDTRGILAALLRGADRRPGRLPGQPRRAPVPQQQRADQADDPAAQGQPRPISLLTSNDAAGGTRWIACSCPS